jgi:DNA polymerase-3 subunit epsilon
MVNRITTGNVFHAYFNPERDMPMEAERVHGLSITFLSDKPLFATRAAELLEFIGDSPLVAHNAQFDFGFLNCELRACDFPEVSLDRMIDTLGIARKRHPGAKHSLDALCVRYGIDRSMREKHGALLDAELLAQVYVELTGGRQIGLELAAETATNVVQIVRFTPQKGNFRAPRPHSATVVELSRHQEFLSKLGIPDWTK